MPKRYHHPDPRGAKRMEILWLKHVEMTHEKIAEIAGVCRSTVQRLLNLYRLSGIEAVRRFLRETLGLKWRKTASVPLPPNRTLEEHVQTQEAFLK
jgi:transposase